MSTSARTPARRVRARIRPGVSSLLGALWLAAIAAGCGPRAARPNVLLVVVDTLRADHMSLYGYDQETTPRLDRWAAGGAVFERAWSACSWTTPSMNMLMTGQVRIQNSGRIRPEQRPLAEVFRNAGYRTGAVVANPLLTHDQRRKDGQEGLAFDRGFDDYELRPAPRERSERNGWTGDEVVRRGLRWLDAESGTDAPFFLFLHLFDPHYPYEPAGGLRFTPRSDPGREAALRSALRPEHAELWNAEVYGEIERRIALYDSEVLQVDRALDGLFDGLRQRGLFEDTLIVLTADHGEGLWQRAATVGEEDKEEAFFPALYYEHGVQLYSEQVHVPLVLRGPGVTAGLRVERGVSLLDLVPTLLALADLPAPGELDGLNVLAAHDAEPRAEIFSLCTRGTTVTVQDRWRLHVPREYRVERWGAEAELYDLQADPLELHPVADVERTAELRARVEAFRAKFERREAGLGPRSAGQAEDMTEIGYAGEGDER